MKRFGLIIATAALAILATASVGSAQMGVAVMWEGGGVPGIFALPITVGTDMILQPMASFAWVSDKGPGAGTGIGLGASLEKHMGSGDTRPLFGGRVMVAIVSPKGGNSYTNFGLGVFVGGAAKLADNLSLVGQWGPDLTIHDKKTSATGKDSWMDLSSSASITLRWFVWGTK